MAPWMEWFCVENDGLADQPKWFRKVGVCPDDGRVFVPAALVGFDMEMIVFLCASQDRATIVEHLNHVYVPAEWMAGQYPDVADTCRVIERRVREYCAGNRGRPDKQRASGNEV